MKTNILTSAIILTAALELTGAQLPAGTSFEGNAVGTVTAAGIADDASAAWSASSATDVQLKVSAYSGDAYGYEPTGARGARLAKFGSAQDRYLSVEAKAGEGVSRAAEVALDSSRVYFDSLVKLTPFTALPGAAAAGDKLSVLVCAASGKPRLYVRSAGGFFDLGDLDVASWHRLTVKTFANVCAGGSAPAVGFSVFVDGCGVKCADADYASRSGLAVLTLGHNARKFFELGNLFLSLDQDSPAARTIRSVTIAGTSSLDDVAFAGSAPVKAAEDFAAPPVLVDGEEVAPEAVIDRARAGSVISLPEGCEVVIDTDTNALSVEGAAKGSFAAYYVLTAQTDAHGLVTVTLALSDDPKKNGSLLAADEEQGIPAVRLVEGGEAGRRFEVSIPESKAGLYYGLEYADNPGFEGAERIWLGEGEKVLSAPAAGAHGFYRVLVTDADPR